MTAPATHLPHTTAVDCEVLLVDDHTVFAQVLAAALGERGIRATTVAADVDGVLAAASGHRFDLAVVDVSFSADGREGIDLIGPLRNLGTRVVMLTGLTDPLVHGRCFREGAIGVIGKSRTFEQLLEVLDLAIAGRPVHPASQAHDLILRLERHEAERRRLLAPFESLTPREEQVLAGLTEGLNATELAEQGYVSLATVRAQIRSILTKVGGHSQLAAVAAAREVGWAPRESPQPCGSDGGSCAGPEPIIDLRDEAPADATAGRDLTPRSGRPRRSAPSRTSHPVRT